MSSFLRVPMLVGCLLGLAAAGCSKDVTIGAIVSESGAVADYGMMVRHGMELAVDEVNAQGLANGGKLTVIYKDDATIAERGRQVATELIDEDGVRVIVGAVSSSVTLAVAPICEDNRVLLLSPSASAPEISQAGEYIYRNFPSAISEGTSMARFAKDLGLERVAIFSHDNDFGKSLADIFTQQYQSRFRAVVKTFLFQEGDTSGFGEMLAELTELDPDGIYVTAYQSDLAALLKALKESGSSLVVMASSAVTPDIVRMAGDAAENLVYPQTTFDLESEDPAVSAFVAAYRRKYDSDPDIYAAHGYDAIKVLVEAINKAGSAHPDDLKIGLNGLHNYKGAAGPTTFDKNGDVIRHPRIMVIEGGGAQAYDEFVENGGSILARS